MSERSEERTSVGELSSMGEALMREAQDEAARVIADAEREAARIAEEAETEARRLVGEALAQAEAAGRLDGQRHRARAELEAARMVARAREEIISECLTRLRGALSTVVEGPDYPMILQHLLAEAVGALRRPTVDVQVRAQDTELIESCWCDDMADRLHATLRVATQPAEIAGGVIVSANQGRLRVDQSFEALLTRHEEALRAIIARELWGDHQRGADPTAPQPARILSPEG